ncbi:periplasmic nitrate reductase, NapE protein [Rhizobium sp. ARZ01]|uniref:periplasmic nitrate reductase, NapE protein n=1 Tax=Rhizobium sp. ARZ01 TaxID=2769313 RepID=UPI00177C490C|nr:periplasmic nitrate reductase, NapE protein [Rhizobium sp. ARZ01]MBD9371107.1 periplasmic nitrate reductase, NapE protein [Rhizobium sp. ARZ01]
MSELSSDQPASHDRRTRRRVELIAFFVLAFGIWPLVAVGVVGGYGFLVWMFQIIYGPPGPPGH